MGDERSQGPAPVRVGIIGAGVISDRYLTNAQRYPNIEMVAIADLDPARSRTRAEQHGITAMTVTELLAEPSIEAVLNLTIPAAHAEVNRAILAAGKHVYSEKPLATDRQSGLELLRLAEHHGLLVGCAPDTFLGAGLQKARAVLDSGTIGTPVAATAFMVGFGPERWHPDPAFFYAPGAGPLFDVGPYYLTMLVHLFGPIAAVNASAVIGRSQRPIYSEPLKGKLIDVTTPTHVSAHIEFVTGPATTLITSFDVPASELPRGEVYGTQGTLSLPDPNTFGGPVKVRLLGDSGWTTLPLSPEPDQDFRGLGLADMAAAIRADAVGVTRQDNGAAHRANGELALHVLDAMQAILESADAREWRGLTTTCERPEPLPQELVA